MWVVTGDTGYNGKRSVGKITLECIFFVTFQADIESVGNEHASFLRRVRVVTVHTGGFFCNRRVFDLGRLIIFDNFLVAFPAKVRGGSL